MTLKITNKNKANKWSRIVMVIILLWITTTLLIQRFKCPKMTETELFINIPKSIVCDWQDCI